MIIKHINSFMKNFNIDLPVTASGSTVTVAECSITCNGQVINLPALSFELKKSLPHKAIYNLYVVQVKSDGTVDWLFDEFIVDGVDQPYQMEGGLFKCLHWAIYVAVPANTTDFKDQEVMVFRTLDPNQQVQEVFDSNQQTQEGLNPNQQVQEVFDSNQQVQEVFDSNQQTQEGLNPNQQAQEA